MSKHSNSSRLSKCYLCKKDVLDMAASFKLFRKNCHLFFVSWRLHPLGGQDGTRWWLSSRSAYLPPLRCLCHRILQTTAWIVLPMAQPYSIPLYPLEVNANASHYHGTNLKALLTQLSSSLRPKPWTLDELACVLNNRNPPRSSHPKTSGIILSSNNANRLVTAFVYVYVYVRSICTICIGSNVSERGKSWKCIETVDKGSWIVLISISVSKRLV